MRKRKQNYLYLIESEMREYSKIHILFISAVPCCKNFFFFQKFWTKAALTRKEVVLQDLTVRTARRMKVGVVLWFYEHFS